MRKLYRALLLAYPAEFRHEYGEEMERLFAERLAEEPAARLWLSALWDAVVIAPREHLQILAADLRYAARLFAQAPAFTLVALLTTGLGIGASSAVFSLVNAVLLRSLPYAQAERLVFLWMPNAHLGPPVPLELGPPPPDFFAWRRESHSFSHMSLSVDQWVRLPGGNVDERIGGARVDGEFFAVLDTAPEIGRTIVAEDDRPGRDQVAVISHALWQSQYAGATDILGKAINVDGHARRIIGVMPPGFEFPRRNELPPDISNTVRTDIWMPAALTPHEKETDSVNSLVIGRLAHGVSLARAQQEMAAIAKRLDEGRKPDERGWYALIRPLAETALAPARPQMWLLLGAVSLVLAIATGNVANLLLARAAGRVQEMSLRSALGAGRARLMRQAITEALLLASGGCLLGMLAARGAVWVLVRLNPGNISRFDQASLDGRVLLFAAAISVATGLTFGLAPALSASRNDPMSVLRQGARGVVGGRRRMRGLLIVAEVAISLVLLAGAGLLIESEMKLAAEGTGFAPSTLSMRIQLPSAYAKPEQRRAFYGRLIAAVRALPGVQAAGLSGDLPFAHRESVALFAVEGYANRKGQLADSWDASPGYLEAMQIPLREGRLFNERDTNSADGPILVNQAFAERYLPGRTPLGRRIRLMNLDGSGRWHTTVGVVGNTRHTRLEEAPRPAIYLPPWPAPDEFLAVRGTGLSQLPSSIHAVVRQLDETVEISDVHTMEEAITKAGAARKFQTALLASFAGMSLFLALVGLYGVVAYSVKQRSGEIGIRMAMGASQGAVIAMVLRQGAGLSAAGLALGLAGALALTRLIAGWLYGVSPVDLATLASVAALLFGVSMAACAFPAWKAARIDPVAALRE